MKLGWIGLGSIGVNMVLRALDGGHEVVATLGDAGRQRLDRSPYVIHRRGQTVNLQAEPTLRVQLDGDSRGTTPRQFRIVPLGLLVVTPQHQTVARSR